MKTDVLRRIVDESCGNNNFLKKTFPRIIPLKIHRSLIEKELLNNDYLWATAMDLGSLHMALYPRPCSSRSRNSSLSIIL